jgi:ATP-dependent helicase/nuclease subunit B
MAGCERNDLGAAVEQERIAEDYESPARRRTRVANASSMSDSVRLGEANLLPVTRQNLERARQILDDAIEQVARQFYSDLAPAIDRVWDDGIDSIRIDLREWLRRASEDDSGYVPWRFELSFGLGGEAKRRQADSHSSAIAVDLDRGIQLRGSIDQHSRSRTRLDVGI